MLQARILGFSNLSRTSRYPLCSSQVCMIAPKSIHGISLANIFFIRTMHILYSIQ